MTQCAVYQSDRIGFQGNNICESIEFAQDKLYRHCRDRCAYCIVYTVLYPGLSGESDLIPESGTTNTIRQACNKHMHLFSEWTTWYFSYIQCDASSVSWSDVRYCKEDKHNVLNINSCFLHKQLCKTLWLNSTLWENKGN